MDDFIARQRNQILFAIEDYRAGLLSLNRLIQQLEGLAHAIGESFWNDRMFPLIIELERVNSDLLDKRRVLAPSEKELVAEVLKAIEQLVC
jgi:hypothetical protein